MVKINEVRKRDVPLSVCRLLENRINRVSVGGIGLFNSLYHLVRELAQSREFMSCSEDDLC